MPLFSHFLYLSQSAAMELGEWSPILSWRHVLRGSVPLQCARAWWLWWESWTGSEWWLRLLQGVLAATTVVGGRAGVGGWPSSCPFASDLSQISCSWTWLTGALGTALEGRSLFSASDLINEWRGSPGRGNCGWPEGYRKYRMKDDFEMCFHFQKSCHVSDVLSMCLSFIWKLLIPLED